MYEDFKVKAKEEDCIVAIELAVSKGVVFVTWDGLQIYPSDDPEKEVFRAKESDPSKARAVFEYHSQGIQSGFKRIKVEEMNAYHRALFETEAPESVQRYEAHVRELWNRVGIDKVLDYIDRIHEYADFYSGIAEMGYDDKPMICANWNHPKLKRIGDWIEKFYHGNIEVDWSDEWMSCSDCNKAVRSQADSYGWQQSWVWASDCDIQCHECTEHSAVDVIDYYVNSLGNTVGGRALPYWMESAIENAGFYCLESDESYCTRFESGFHPGQNDTPEKALKLAKEILPYKFDYLFMITDRGQFDIHWTMYVRKQEVEVES